MVPGKKRGITCYRVVCSLVTDSTLTHSLPIESNWPACDNWQNWSDYTNWQPAHMCNVKFQSYNQRGKCVQYLNSHKNSSVCNYLIDQPTKDNLVGHNCDHNHPYFKCQSPPTQHHTNTKAIGHWPILSLKNTDKTLRDSLLLWELV